MRATLLERHFTARRTRMFSVALSVFPRESVTVSVTVRYPAFAKRGLTLAPLASWALPPSPKFHEYLSGPLPVD